MTHPLPSPRSADWRLTPQTTGNARAVLFDLDGVLVTTDDYHYLGWSRVAKEEGIPFTREDNHRQRGIGRMESLEILLEKAPRAYSMEDKVALAKRKNDYYVALLDRLTPADTLPGARELLQQLRSLGIPCAIGSSSRNTPTILERTGLRGLLDVVVDGNDITEGKPNPEVFLKAAERLGVPPSECVVVEDAQSGVEAARRAGMRVFAIGPESRHPDVANRAESLAGVSAEALLSAGF